jgi:hypothetical protein
MSDTPTTHRWTVHGDLSKRSLCTDAPSGNPVTSLDPRAPLTVIMVGLVAPTVDETSVNSAP